VRTLAWVPEHNVKRRRPPADATDMTDARIADRRTLNWRLTFQWVVAIAVTCLLAALTFSRGGWVPLLSRADLGIHEFGHLVVWWAPELMVQFAGSVMQVALPLALGGYFLWRRDRMAVVLMLAWAAESLNNVSVYIYDATRMELPLVGDDGSGAGHDWHNILSRLGALRHTDAIAYTVRGLSVALFAVAVGLAVWWWVRCRRESTFSEPARSVYGSDGPPDLDHADVVDHRRNLSVAQRAPHVSQGFELQGLEREHDPLQAFGEGVLGMGIRGRVPRFGVEQLHGPVEVREAGLVVREAERDKDRELQQVLPPGLFENAALVGADPHVDQRKHHSSGVQRLGGSVGVVEHHLVIRQA
jgi:hypothetical protein